MADPCMDLVRQWDRDRYLATLFAPDDKQPLLFALYAFDAEISRIPTLVSEPQIGEIRMQWWADTLDAIEHGDDIDHPVAQRLAATMRAHALPAEHLHTLIEARRAELYEDVFPDRTSLEGYIGETGSGLMQFAAMILDPVAARAATDVTGLAGVALGLSRLLNQTPLHPRFLPPGETLPSLKALAQQRLNEARNFAIPSSLLPALLPACLTEDYLRGNPSALKRQWHLWRAARSGRL